MNQTCANQSYDKHEPNLYQSVLRKTRTKLVSISLTININQTCNGQSSDKHESNLYQSVLR